ncbi:PKD domain-containing protein [Pedobacter sp. MC2016-14]|uniref:PKD domain-containing protein n=1 Tax=Pedobacter sp. MC2016-14 TaxID=2897327 RepID=UPI001E5D49F2|nr:PKD domain-containing protein [Pedobacter sp. MC2016-14]MCD0487013.1 PKD domain-containing protein [Pedobacter sp. MC2016-14]
MKKLFVLAILLSMLLTFQVRGQVTFGTVDPGPYANSSTISVPITVSNTTCLAANNTFELWLSAPNGSFTTGQRRIGTLSGFFSTHINGSFELVTAVSSNYKLQVRTTNPANVYEYPGTINFVSGTGPFVGVNPSAPSQVLSAGAVFGWCGSAVSDNKSMDLVNNSSSPTVQKLFLKNEKTGTTQEYPLLGDGTYALTGIDQTYYTVTVTGERLVNGTTIKSSKSYLLLNIQSKINIQSFGSPFGCIDPRSTLGADIAYKINTTGESGIQENYPGTTYRITWGDNKTDIITHCALLNNDGILNHTYQQTSCGRPPINLGNGNTITNSYNVSATSINPFCQSAPAAVSIYPKIYTMPVALIDPVTIRPACLNTPINFTNKSTSGTNADCSLSMIYEWYIDGVRVSTAQSYTHPGFSTPGIHTIRLVSKNDIDNICQPSEDFREICIQAAPQPSFNFIGNPDITACAPGMIKPTNTSIIDANCNPNNTYLWTVTGGTVTYTGGTSASSAEPEFNFNSPGIYKVKLSVTTASCGMRSTEEQTIVINGPPVATLAPDIELCNKGVYSFNPTATSTKTILTGTQQDLADSYTWTVTGGNYAFTGGTNANSKYPEIEFTEYNSYTVTVFHKNNCGTSTDSQELKFTVAPEVTVSSNQPICFTDQVQLNGSVTGTVTSTAWIGGNGTFNPNRNVLNPIYTPTLAEREAGMLTLTLRVTTSLAEPCNVINKDVSINIKPKIAITSPNMVSICTGTALNYSITSSVVGTTYSWTATGTANASGYASSGSGDMITEMLTNTNALNNATVTYVITPANDGCTGAPFTLVVTVTPNPVVTVTPANSTICNNQSTAIALSANLSNIRYTWTSTITGSITGNSTGTLPTVTSAINDVLFNSGTTAGTVTYTITPISANNCTGTAVSTTITIVPSVTVANAGLDESICISSTYILNGNNPTVGTGKWTLISGQSGITFGDDIQYNTQVSGLQAGQSYTFRWTISSAFGCTASVDDVTITVSQASIGGTTTGATTLCAGSNAGVIDLSGQTGAVISWESSVDNGLTWQSIAAMTSSYAYSNLTVSTQFRAIVKSGNCAAVPSTPTTITILPAISNNSINDAQTICTGNTPVAFTGSVPAGADGNFIYQWQRSMDNGITWVNIDGATAINFAPPALSTTTTYRRLVSSAQCAGGLQSISNNIVITVNPDARAEFTASTYISCAPFTLDAQNITATAYPDRNDTYTWYANGVSIGTGVAFPGYTITDNNRTVSIKLQVTSSLGCAIAELSRDFTTRQNIVASFTPSTTSGCGATTVTFTNTTPDIAGATYSWDFGDGSPASTQRNPAPHPYPADPAGNDLIYKVKLTVTTICGTSTTPEQNISIKVKPVPRLTPDRTTGCAPMLVTFTNTTAGETNTYVINFGDGSALRTVTTKDTVQHTYFNNGTTNRSFIVSMSASNSCGGNPASNQATILVSPQTINVQMAVDGPELQGCAPHVVNLRNNSFGATQYTYDFGDGSEVIGPTSLPPPPHTYTSGGNYTITVTAFNSCTPTGISKTLGVTVYAQPNVAFEPDLTSGCPGLTVRFTNNTTGAAAYTWDFGDGTQSTLRNPPPHVYSGTQEFYTVTLTAVNNQNCPAVLQRSQLIRIQPAPLAQFNVLPGTVINIPNYTFNFQDESTNTPTKWEWDFGDGSVTSVLKNPAHTYADTGSYQVKLKVENATGCTATVTKTVRITGIPGYVFVPNSFIPASSTPALREFKAKGSGISSWRMTIFNKWGEVLWETTKLENGRPAEGWDGTFRGTPVQQGVYYWKIDVQMENGIPWTGMSFNGSAPKRTGIINLIR